MESRGPAAPEPLSLTAAPPSISPQSGLLLGLGLVALNGFFVAAEFALVKVRPDAARPAGARPAAAAASWRATCWATSTPTSRPPSSASLSPASRSAGWASRRSPGSSNRWSKRIPGATPALVHSLSLTVAFLSITALHIVLGEQAPKSFAIRRPEATSLWIAFPLYVFYWVTFPAIWLLNAPSIGLLRLIGSAPATRTTYGAHSEEELRLLLAAGQTPELSDDKRETARQRLRALRSRRTPGHGAARRRGLPVDKPDGRGEPAPRPRQRPHPLPALRGRPRPHRGHDPHQGPLPRRAATRRPRGGSRAR